MRLVLDELGNVSWANPLLSAIRRGGGITFENQPLLFEARIAYEFHRQGVTPQYEFETGVGESSVDFRIPSEPEFLVEVVSLRASESAGRATRPIGDGSYFKTALSTANQRVEGREQESTTFQLILAQRKLGEKVYVDGRATKFPEPTAGTYHIIVADVRYIVGDRRDHIRALDDYLRLLTLGYGHGDVARGQPFVVGAGVDQNDGSTSNLRGIFEEGVENPRAAPFLRQRIHAIHFVCERDYGDDEVRGDAASYPITNDSLFRNFEELKAMAAAYPLGVRPKAGQ